MLRKRFCVLLLPASICLTFQLVVLYRLTVPLISDTEGLHFPVPSDSKHTLVHCVGENFLEASSWQFKSCHYRNLCYESGEWTIHPSWSQLQLEEDNVWSSTRLKQNISTIGLRPQWIRRKQHRWSPKIREQAFRNTNKKLFPDIVVLVISMPPFQSVLELFMHTLLPLYNLMEIFALPQGKSIFVHVLNSNEIDTKLLNLGLDWMGYSRFVPPSPNATTSLCVSHVASGIGMLTVTGLTRRGHVADDYEAVKLRNVGRGPLFERFRNYICQTLDIDKSPTTASSTMRLALPKSHFLFSSLMQELQNSIPPPWSVHEADLSNPASAMAIAASTNVWVALANNDTFTWPALFLPRDSHLILLYDPNVRVKNKNDKHDPRPARRDFGLWNQMSHIQVHWLSISHKPETLVNLLKRILADNDRNGIQIAEKWNVADASFNGLDVRMTEYKPQSSTSHCVGENWMRHAEVYRSCHMQRICFDLNQRKFVLDMPSPSENELLPSDVVSTWADNHTTKVMMGQSIWYPRDDVWFPTLRTERQQSDDYFYALDSNVVWLPYYPMQPNVNNPGHLLWDYWLPLYNLLDMFQLRDKSLLLTNLDPWCVAHSADLTCYNLTTKFLPLLGVDPVTFASTFNSQLVLRNRTAAPSSSLVCAQHGLAGIGMLTDHGINKHGQLLSDYKQVHNVGRGPMFWDFRNFMLGKMGIANRTRPFKITFSIFSSRNPSRRRSFEKQIQLAKQLYQPKSKEGVVVQSVIMWELSLQEQLAVVHDSAVFISVIGGSASTAMFLQKDTSLILYYNDIDDLVKGAEDEQMANRMDWDFWNNASYLRVHWLSILSMDEERDLKAFSRLLQSEMESVILLHSTKTK
jgi:hypothetical protein